jgi:hypothetical protein
MPAADEVAGVALGFHFWSGCLPCEGGGTRLGSGESERGRAEGLTWSRRGGIGMGEERRRGRRRGRRRLGVLGERREDESDI